MSTKKISQLNSLLSGSVSLTGDAIAIVNSSETKKITPQQLKGAIVDPSLIYEIGTGANSIKPLSASFNATANGNFSTVGGGQSNSTTGTHSTIAGGCANNISGGIYQTVSGGWLNRVSGSYSAVGGGGNNIVSASSAVIGGGTSNKVLVNYGTLLGGATNCVSNGKYGFIGGGQFNHISGSSNQGQYSVINGGYSNTNSGQYSSIGGGFQNQAKNNPYITIGGGLTNAACSQAATIAGGASNIVENQYGWEFIGGGLCNKVAAQHGVVAGGYCNYVTINGFNSGILGGCKNTVNNSGSFAIGIDITTDADKTTFVNNLHITGSTTADSILKLSRRDTTPSPAVEGMIIASGSAGASNLYYYNGSTWTALA